MVGWGLFVFWLVGCVGFLDGWLGWFLALFVCLFLVQKSSVSLFLRSKSGLYTGVCQFPGIFQSFYSVDFSDCIIFGLVGALTLYSILKWVKPAMVCIAHPLCVGDWDFCISLQDCRCVLQTLLSPSHTSSLAATTGLCVFCDHSADTECSWSFSVLACVMMRPKEMNDGCEAQILHLPASKIRPGAGRVPGSSVQRGPKI